MTTSQSCLKNSLECPMIMNALPRLGFQKLAQQCIYQHKRNHWIQKHWNTICTSKHEGSCVSNVHALRSVGVASIESLSTASDINIECLQQNTTHRFTYLRLQPVDINLIKCRKLPCAPTHDRKGFSQQNSTEISEYHDSGSGNAVSSRL